MNIAIKSRITLPLFRNTDNARSLQRYLFGGRLMVNKTSHFAPLYRNTHHSTSPHIIHSQNMELKGRILVYSIVGCPYCMRSKNTLQERKLRFFDISLDCYPQERALLKAKTNRRTVPQIFFNNIHVGGNDELQKAAADSEAWQKLLDEVINNESPADGPQPPDPSTAVIQDAIYADFHCEKDEMALLANQLKSCGIIGDHRSGLFRTAKQSFYGKDFVEYVMKNKELDREHAIEMGQALIDRHFSHAVSGHSQTNFKDDTTLYRLLEDEDISALNSGSTSDCEPRPVADLGEDLRKLILKLYAVFINPDGTTVNYKGMAKSVEFEKYKLLTKELVRVRVEDANREEKIAFFVNVYNALNIHATITWYLSPKQGPPRNLWERYKFFSNEKYIIGGHPYSLQEIENGILRANRKGVGMLFRPFGKNDPRLKVALDSPEPLIHFALNCGAKSCPPIKTFSVQGLNNELRMAAEAFLEMDDGMQIDMYKKQISLSKIFTWYKEDFGNSNQEVLEALHKLMGSGRKKSELGELLEGKKYSVVYLEYDWGHNSKE